jgi:hypothetical protein
MMGRLLSILLSLHEPKESWISCRSLYFIIYFHSSPISTTFFFCAAVIHSQISGIESQYVEVCSVECSLSMFNYLSLVRLIEWNCWKIKIYTTELLKLYKNFYKWQRHFKYLVLWFQNKSIIEGRIHWSSIVFSCCYSTIIKRTSTLILFLWLWSF